MLAPTACIIIIGNEILSGRTQDKNVAWLAHELNEAGIRLSEVRVIPDTEQVIIDTVNYCRKLFTYVFTTGGIGPTHDDITSAAIAKAFNLPFVRHPEAERRLLAHYTPDQVNAARMKMADMPQGAQLISNPVSIAPGFRVENVYVLAGVPSIMQAMFDSLRHGLRGGAKMLSKTISAYITEGMIAEKLSVLQNNYPEVEIGSYPFIRDGKLGVSLVARCTDCAKLDRAYQDIKALLLTKTKDIAEEDLAA
jgi:molybdenum cofactor synthesis domain-containing protein